MMGRPSTMPEARGDGAAARDLTRARLASLAVLFVLLAVTFTMPLFVHEIHATALAPKMLFTQDILILPLVCGAIMLLRGRHGPMIPSLLATRLAWSSRRWLAAAAIALLAICIGGHWWVFDGIDLTRDEQMAVFDAAIFRSGHLMVPIPPAWQPIAPALNLLFTLPIGDHAAWVSSYLPVNAALRALVGVVADPVLTSPLLVITGLVALASIARRLWPESPGSQCTALLCYLGSSQIVITGMTAYASSAHLALNLVWLMLFLRRDRIGFVGTILVGFLSTGAHQPLFHPLFALPFVLDMLRQRQDGRQWARFVAYGVGYALIVGFWSAWPIWMSAAAGPVPTANDVDGISFVARLMRLLAMINVGAIWIMSANILRFIAWQHLLLLPLALLGCIGGWRRWPLVRPLAIGLLLPLIIIGILLPWQGHGWGYRYLHPVLGSACLLAGYGWRRAEEMEIDLRPAMLCASAASILLLPVHAWMANRMVKPQAVLEHAIARLPATFVVIDDEALSYSPNLVINAPDLSNRPIRLLGSKLKPTDMAGLCRGQVVDFVDAPALSGLGDYFYERFAPRATAHQRMLQHAARAGGCLIGGR